MSAPLRLPTKLHQDNNQQLLDIARHIRGLSQTASAAVIEIGRGLLRAKDLSDHGSFGPWVKSACGFTPRSAQNYMRAALLANGKSETVSHLSPGALYLLSSKSTPAAVLSIVLKWLEQGRVASESEVEMLLAQHRQIGCLEDDDDRSNAADQSVALASELMHFAGSELIRRLTKAPWNHVRVELLRLLNTSSRSAPAGQQPMCDDTGGNQRAGIELVRDANDANLFRAGRGDAGETQPSPINSLMNDSVQITPLAPPAVADGLEHGTSHLVLEHAMLSSGTDFLPDSDQPQEDPVVTSVDFLADSEGALHGIPNFLRRAQSVTSTSAERDVVHVE